MTDTPAKPIGIIASIATAIAIGPLIGMPAGGLLGLFYAWSQQSPLPPGTAGCGMFAIGCILTGSILGSLVAIVTVAGWLLHSGRSGHIDESTGRTESDPQTAE